MDNDMNVTGDRFHPCSLGQLIRLCLLCRVIPVFTPDRQPAANARGERYNGLLQERVWQRDRFRTLPYLMPRSYHFQIASNTYSHTPADPSGAARARERHTVSVPFRVPHPLARCRGQIWVVRSIDEDGHIQVLNETIRLPTR